MNKIYKLDALMVTILFLAGCGGGGGGGGENGTDAALFDVSVLSAGSLIILANSAFPETGSYTLETIWSGQ